MTVIEIRPHRWGWKAFESPGVEPVFPKKDQAMDYAQNRACFRSGEVRIFDSTGNVACVIPFDDANRKLSDDFPLIQPDLWIIIVRGRSLPLKELPKDVQVLRLAQPRFFACAHRAPRRPYSLLVCSAE
jgi:hypothetical protein